MTTRPAPLNIHVQSCHPDKTDCPTPRWTVGLYNPAEPDPESPEKKSAAFFSPPLATHGKKVGYPLPAKAVKDYQKERARRETHIVFNTQLLEQKSWDEVAPLPPLPPGALPGARFQDMVSGHGSFQGRGRV